MILNPGVLALLVGSGCVVLLLAVCSWHAAAIVRRWDFSSSSAGQLALERKTHLVSTVVAYAMGFQLLSTILFVHAVDDLHGLLTGAMCATGTLNANPVGWYALGVKIFLLFATGFWLAVNAVDSRAEDLPLCRRKFALLLFLAPGVALDFWLQLRYFLGLHPDVITSCCGSLFSTDGKGLASTLSALPAIPSLYVFYGSAVAYFAAAYAAWRRPSRAGHYSLAALSVWFFTAAGTTIVSAISLYLYESPIHHCPFDFLQADYGYFGYPVYLSLGLGVFFGVLPAAFEPAKAVGWVKRSGPTTEEMTTMLEGLQHKWVLVSAVGTAVFVALVTGSIWMSRLTLLE